MPPRTRPAIDVDDPLAAGVGDRATEHGFGRKPGFGVDLVGLGLVGFDLGCGTGFGDVCH